MEPSKKSKQNKIALDITASKEGQKWLVKEWHYYKNDFSVRDPWFLQTDRKLSRLEKSSGIFAYGSLRRPYGKIVFFPCGLLRGLYVKISSFLHANHLRARMEKWVSIFTCGPLKIPANKKNHPFFSSPSTLFSLPPLQIISISSLSLSILVSPLSLSLPILFYLSFSYVLPALSPRAGSDDREQDGWQWRRRAADLAAPPSGRLDPPP